jgi:uncharacterized cupredoxin-like copper-binding protein
MRIHFAALAFAAALPSRGGLLHQAAAAHELRIVARDYAFDAPATIAAGVTTVFLANKGSELHHAVILRLDEGHTAADFETALAAQAPIPWVKGVGGPNAVPPGGESSTTMSLEPGHYVVTCFIPTADGTPHIMKGMIRELTVTGSHSMALLPPADIIVALTDYGFKFSTPLTAGHHVILARDDAVQDHELVLLRLQPGKPVREMLVWAHHPVGPPPAMPIGGFTVLSTGRSSEMTVDLTPGEYGLICYVPDSHDGKPHAEHGMVQQITVM